MTYFTNLIGRLRKLLGRNAGSPTSASDPLVPPAEESVPPPALETPIAPK